MGWLFTQVYSLFLATPCPYPPRVSSVIAINDKTKSWYVRKAFAIFINYKFKHKRESKFTLCIKEGSSSSSLSRAPVRLPCRFEGGINWTPGENKFLSLSLCLSCWQNIKIKGNLLFKKANFILTLSLFDRTIFKVLIVHSVYILCSLFFFPTLPVLSFPFFIFFHFPFFKENGTQNKYYIIFITFQSPSSVFVLLWFFFPVM